MSSCKVILPVPVASLQMLCLNCELFVHVMYSSYMNVFEYTYKFLCVHELVDVRIFVMMSECMYIVFACTSRCICIGLCDFMFAQRCMLILYMYNVHVYAPMHTHICKHQLFLFVLCHVLFTMTCTYGV